MTDLTSLSGPAAGVIILALSGVIGKLYAELSVSRKDLLTEKDARIGEAKESRDQVVAPLELLGRQNQLILDKLDQK